MDIQNLLADYEYNESDIFEPSDDDNLPLIDDYEFVEYATPKTVKNKFNKRHKDTILGAYDFETYQAYPSQQPIIDKKGITLYPICTDFYYGCCVLETGEKYTFYKLSDFVDYLLEKRDNPLQLYAHNQKFDFSFILPYLIRNKISYTKVETGLAHVFVEINGNLLINSSGLYTGFSVKKLGELLQKPKLEHNVLYYKDTHTQPSADDIKYCLRDCEIVLQAVQLYINAIDKLYQGTGINSCKGNAYTGASVAYFLWKNVCLKTNKKIQDNVHLQLDIKNFCKKAYKGGRVYNKTGVYHNVYGYDLVNCYPSCMVENLYPIGKPYTHVGNNLPKDCFFIAEFVFSNLRLKDGGISWLPWLDDMLKLRKGGTMRITLCEIDYEHIYNNYDYDNLEYIKCYKWSKLPKHGMSMHGADLFGNFIFTFRDEMQRLKHSKVDMDKSIRTAYKSAFNGLYGKYGSSYYQDEYHEEIDGTGKVKRVYDKYNEYTPELNKYYLPFSVYITAYARKKTFDAITAIGVENVIYGDTDSIKTLVPLPDDMLGEFGKWEHEATYKEFRVYAPKVYAYIDDKDNFGYRYKGQKTFDTDGKELYTCFADMEQPRYNQVLQFKTVINGQAPVPIYKQSGIIL